MRQITHRSSGTMFFFFFLFMTISTPVSGMSGTNRVSPPPSRENASRRQIIQLDYRIKRLEERLLEMDNRFNSVSALEISGFFDVSISNYKNKPNIFSMGNLELDLSHNYDNHFQVAAALVFNDDKGTYLGVGFIDYRFSGGSVPPRGRLFIERGVHIQVGRFDVPLGNDWNYVSAVNRITVTPPLTTERLMEGVYNDVGIRLLANFVSLNLSLYSTQGIERKYSYGGLSYGARIGITPFNNPYTIKNKQIPALEIGISLLQDLDNQGKLSDQVLVVDYESKTGPLSLRGEYYKREKAAGVLFNGYHLTTGLNLSNPRSSPIVLFLRYDYYSEKNNIIVSDDDVYKGAFGVEEHLKRISMGLNLNISNTSFLKLEYHKYVDSTKKFVSDTYFTESLYYTQLVITF